MAKGVMFSPGAAARIKASVRKTEGALRTQAETQRGQILGKTQDTIRIKVDRDIEPYAPIRYSRVSLNDGEYIAEERTYDLYSTSGYYYDELAALNAVAPASGVNSGDIGTFLLGVVPVRVKLASWMTKANLAHHTFVPWGMTPEMDGVTVGLPGWIYVGDYDATTHTAKFIAQRCLESRAYVPALTGSSKYGAYDSRVLALATGKFSTNVYDGTGDLPKVQVQLFPTGATNYSRSINVGVGDILWYRKSDELWRFDGHLDEPVRTVRLAAGTVSDLQTPRGWAKMDGTDNSAANGGSAINISGSLIKGAVTTAIYAGIVETGTDGTVASQELQAFERLSYNINV